MRIDIRRLVALVATVAAVLAGAPASAQYFGRNKVQYNVIQGELGEDTGGVTEPLRRRIVLPLGGPLAANEAPPQTVE